MLVVHGWVVVYVLIKTTISRFAGFNRLFCVLSRLSHIIVIGKISSTVNSIPTYEESVSLASLVVWSYDTWCLRVELCFLRNRLSPAIHLHQVLFRAIFHARGSFILFSTVLILHILLVCRLSDSIQLNVTNWSFLTPLCLVLNSVQTVWIIV